MTKIEKIIKKVGIDKYDLLYNIAKVAIWEDNYGEDQRLSFADGVRNHFPEMEVEELTEIFLHCLWMQNN